MLKPFVVAAAMFIAVVPAQARDIPSRGFTLNDVVTWLQQEGYSAQIVDDTDGKQHVKSSYGGWTFGVYMFDCKDGYCGSMQFAAGFARHGTFDTSRMNEWNKLKRWARGYYDSSNDPWVEYDVDLTPGGTYELLDDEFATYRKMLDLFVEFYHLK